MYQCKLAWQKDITASTICKCRRKPRQTDSRRALLLCYALQSFLWIFKCSSASSGLDQTVICWILNKILSQRRKEKTIAASLSSEGEFYKKKQKNMSNFEITEKIIQSGSFIKHREIYISKYMESIHLWTHREKNFWRNTSEVFFLLISLCGLSVLDVPAAAGWHSPSCVLSSCVCAQDRVTPDGQIFFFFMS